MQAYYQFEKNLLNIICVTCTINSSLLNDSQLNLDILSEKNQLIAKHYDLAAFITSIYTWCMHEYIQFLLVIAVLHSKIL